MHILKYHIKYFSEFLYGTDFDQNRLLVIPQMPYKTANEVREEKFCVVMTTLQLPQVH